MDASLTPPQPVHRQDYRAPDWLVPDISLSFELDPACTRVAAVLSVTRNGDHDRPLRLDGGELHPLKVAVDGRVLGADEWRMEEGQLVLDLPGASATVETVVEIAPEKNTKLMGLYASRGLLCTQCERSEEHTSELQSLMRI